MLYDLNQKPPDPMTLLRTRVAALERQLAELEHRVCYLEQTPKSPPSQTGAGEAPATDTSSATPPEIEWWDERDVLLGDMQKAQKEIASLRAQLAARPAVTATDAQVNHLRDALLATTSDMYATTIRNWLSALSGVVKEPNNA